MKCAGCSRQIVTGDRYIEDTPSGFVGASDDTGIDGLIDMILGDGDGRLRYCESCCESGGRYSWLVAEDGPNVP